MFSKLRCGIYACALIAAVPAGAASYVATAANLMSIWGTVKAGDTINLVGNFKGATLLNKSFAKVVTINAAKATFTDTLKFQNVSNLKLVGGIYDSTGGRTSQNKSILVYNSSNIFFDKTTIIGRVQDQADGIVIQNVTNSRVTNATFTNLGIGVAISASTKATLSGNTVIGSTRDGFDIYNDHDVVVNNNTCRGSQPAAGAHPDCVQLLSVKGQAIESDIKVIDNIATGNTQGFTLFASDNDGGLRITMMGNIINGLQPQGIACYGCIDSVITGNFLSPQPGAAHFVNLNHYLGINNTIEDNSFVQLKNALTLPSDYDSAYFQLTGMQYHPRLSITAGSEVANLDGGFGANAVPEPGQWALLIAGFAAVGIVQRRRSRWGAAVAA